MAKKEKSEYMIQAVSHALDLLEQFHGEDVDELGVTELSKRLKLHKNNVFRLLATLEFRGYIEQNKATENYRLGLKSLELGQTFIKKMGLLHQAKPVLENLVERCNETSYVAIFKDGYIVYLDAHCTAAGKVHLAFMSEEELHSILSSKDLRGYTPHSITDRETLKKELQKVAEQGYALDNEELDLGVRCVAAPIRDYTRRIVGALSISGPSTRFTDERLEKELIPLVVNSAEELSTRLGFHK
jgi:IclR family KDG regulon transcriptional repressor